MSRRSIPEEGRYTVFRHRHDNPFVCFYCGEPAATLDHCPPRSRVADYESMGLVHEAYVKVSCCEECNFLLGASLQVDLIEREMVLKRRLEKRYRKLIQSPEWTQGEIREKELRGRLKQYTENWQARKDWIDRRLEYAEGINALLEAIDAKNSPFRLVAKIAREAS